MNPTRAVIYGRVSTRGQEDGSSLQTQEEDGRKYCQKQGYIVTQVVNDVHSGFDMDRPGLQEVLSLIKRGEADVLVTWDMFRLSRNQTHQAVILYQVIEECGADAEFTTTGKLDDSAMGKFMRQSIGFVAEVEREKIKERTQRGLKARATRGSILPGPHPIYGYLWSEGRLSFVIDSATAPIVRRIFDEAAQGRRLYGIARGLNDDGIPTALQYFHSIGLVNRQPSSGWKISTVAQILHNPAYTGNHTAYRWKTVKERRKDKKTGQYRMMSVRTERIDNEEDAQLIVPLPDTACPAIIDQAIYEQAQQQLTKNKAQALRNTKNPEAALLARGFVICGYCGKPMGVTTGSKRDYRYRCMRKPYVSAQYREACFEGTSVQAKQIDADVWEKTLESIKEPSILLRALDRRQEESKSAQEQVQSQINSFNKLIDQAKAKRAKFIDKFGDSEDDDDIANKIKQMGQEITKLTEEKEKVVRLMPSSEDYDDLRQLINDLHEEMKGMPDRREVYRILSAFDRADFASIEFRRKVLSVLGVKVRVCRGEDGHGASWKVEFGFNGFDSVNSAD